jgi:alcohol dehydrogenase class IV
LEVSDSASPETAAEMLIERIEKLCREVGIPQRLGQIGVRPEQIPDLVRDSRGSSMSGNPRELSDDELAEILEHML